MQVLGFCDLIDRPLIPPLACLVLHLSMHIAYLSIILPTIKLAEHEMKLSCVTNILLLNLEVPLITHST